MQQGNNNECDQWGIAYFPYWGLRGEQLYLPGRVVSDVHVLDSAPAAVTLSQPFADEVMVDGFTVLGDYRFHLRRAPSGQIDYNEKYVVVHIVTSLPATPVANGTTSSTPVVPPGAVQLTHDLSGGAQLVIWVNNGLVVSPPAPSVMLPTSASLGTRYAAADPAFVTALKSLAGQNATAVAAAMASILAAWKIAAQSTSATVPGDGARIAGFVTGGGWKKS